MAKINIGSKFFKRSRLEYSDWVLAVIRELVQNSQDAGSSLISLNLTKIEDQTCLLVCSDNGRGMNRETLEKVFFALGETSKDQDNDTGGFGKARELTCFSMDSYEIRTNDILVQGSGDEYHIYEGSEHVNGCSFSIIIDASYEEINRAINRYFSHSNPTCTVELNGSRIDNFPNIGSYRRSLSFGNVYVNENTGNNGNMCYIRVNGLFMYSRYISAKASVYLELNPSMSRKILTANRDGIASREFNAEIDKFFNELAVDIWSALKKKNNNKSQFFLGYNGFKTFTPKRDYVRKSYSSNQENQEYVASYSSTETVIAHNEQLNKNNTNRPGNLFDYYNMYILDETENTEYYSLMRSKIDRYNPKMWLDEKSFGGNRSKLIRMWYAACEFCAELYTELNKNCEPFKMGIGWVFSDSKEAVCASRKIKNDVVHFLCLRPVDMDGKVVYSISDKNDWHKLAFLALHEVCHIGEEYHNERFAGMMTNLSYILSSRMKEVFERMERATYI